MTEKEIEDEEDEEEGEVRGHNEGKERRRVSRSGSGRVPKSNSINARQCPAARPL